MEKIKINKNRCNVYLMIYSSMLFLAIILAWQFSAVFLKNIFITVDFYKHIGALIILLVLILLSLFGIWGFTIQCLSFMRLKNIDINIKKDSITVNKDGQRFQIFNNKDTHIFFYAGGWWITWVANSIRYVIFLNKGLFSKKEFCKLTSYLRLNKYYVSSKKNMTKLLKQFHINPFNAIRYIVWPPVVLGRGSHVQ